jgi:hypothetical protein
MSTATVTLSAEDAEAKAAELRELIAENDAFLAQADQLIQQAAQDEARNGKNGSKFSQASVLQKRKQKAQDAQPILRGHLLAFEEIVAEHQAEAAAKRRAEVHAKAAGLDKEEREAIAAVVARFQEFNAVASTLFDVQARRRSFRLANNGDLEGYPESALDVLDMNGTPRTLRSVFDALHLAMFEPGAVGDIRHLNGWQDFIH